MDPFTSRLSKLIKASFIAPDDGPTKESDELREKGVFKKSFLQQVFRNVADNLISDEEFLKLLESLKIAVHIEGDEYFLPSALSLEPPSGGSSFDSNSNPLALLWDELILPHGFFLTVSVELQDKTGGEEGYVFELRSDKPQWRGAIQLNEVKGQIPGVVMLTDRQRWIEVAYSGDSTYCPIVYRAVSSATRRAIERLRHTGIDSPTVGLTCPLCERKDHYCTIAKDRRFVTCSNDSSKTGPVTENISCWFEGGVLREGQAIGCDHEDGKDDLKDLSPLDVFNSHTPQIMGVVSNTDSLITGLISVGVLSEDDTTITTDNGTISRHQRVEKIMKTIQNHLAMSRNPGETLVKFATVLKNQDDEALKQISTDIRSKLILSKPPLHSDVFRALKERSFDWNSFGRELQVPYGYRESLTREGIQRTDEEKLESILNKWAESECSQVSWLTVLKVLKVLQYNEVLESTRLLLKREDILKKYLKND